jgi:membrane associated rhomboid family serine protease
MSFYRQGPQRPTGFSIGVPGLSPMVKKILIATAAVWVGQIVLEWAGIDIVRDPGGYGLGVIPERVVRGALWQPITYMFLHDTQWLMHILFNMLMLWMFGGELERFWGPRAFLRYYLVCGIGGGVAAVLLGISFGGMHARAATIGASGALFGLFVAFGIIFARRTVLFLFVFPMQARTMALILVVANLVFLLRLGDSRVSHVAHLGGALAGYLYLKRAWRIGEFYRELRWKILRRKFKVMSNKDPDDWLH